MSFSWTLGLADRFSPAAVAATRSAQTTDAALKGLAASATQTAAALTLAGNAARGAAGAYSDAAGRVRASGARFASAGDAAKNAGAKVKAAGEHMRGAGRGAREGEGGLAAFTGGVGRLAAALGLLQLAKGALSFLAEGVGYAAEMQAFKESALTTFKVLEGTAEGGAALLDRADLVARALGAKTSKAVEAFRELRAGGFNQKETEAIFSGLSDLKAFNPKAQVDTIATQMTQLLGAGKITEEDMKPIRNAGLDDSIYYQVLREMTGITDQKKLKKKLSSATGIDSQIGISAILETIRRQTKEDTLGQFANERSRTTVGGAVDNLKAMWERLFIYVNGSPIGEQIARVANQVAGMLDPSTESGGRFLAILDRVVVIVGSVFDALATEGAITKTIGWIQDFGDTAMRVFGPFVKGLLQGLGETFGVVGQVVSRLGISVGGAGSAFEVIGRTLGWVLAVGAGVLGVMLGVGGAILFVAYQALYWGGQLIYNLGKGIFVFFAIIGSMLGSLYDVGGDLVAGLWRGIQWGWGKMIEGFKALVALLPESVKTALGIASPSRVMFQLGGYTAAGLTLGLLAGGSDVESAARGLARRASTGAEMGLTWPAGTTGGAAGGSGVSISIDVSGGIHITIATQGDASAIDPAALANEITGQIATALFDQMVSQGALPPRDPLT